MVSFPVPHPPYPHPSWFHSPVLPDILLLLGADNDGVVDYRGVPVQLLQVDADGVDGFETMR